MVLKMDFNDCTQFYSSTPLLQRLAHFTPLSAPRLFCQLACLSGNDYIESLPGIGVSTALKLVDKFRHMSADSRVRAIVMHINTKAKLSEEEVHEYLNKFFIAEAAFFHAFVWDPVNECVQRFTHITRLEDSAFPRFKAESDSFAIPMSADLTPLGEIRTPSIYEAMREELIGADRIPTSIDQHSPDVSVSSKSPRPFVPAPSKPLNPFPTISHSILKSSPVVPPKSSVIDLSAVARLISGGPQIPYSLTHKHPQLQDTAKKTVNHFARSLPAQLENPQLTKEACKHFFSKPTEEAAAESTEPHPPIEPLSRCNSVPKRQSCAISRVSTEPLARRPSTTKKRKTQPKDKATARTKDLRSFFTQIL